MFRSTNQNKQHPLRQNREKQHYPKRLLRSKILKNVGRYWPIVKLASTHTKTIFHRKTVPGLIARSKGIWSYPMVKIRAHLIWAFYASDWRTLLKIKGK